MLFSFAGMGLLAAMTISSIGWGSIKGDLMKVPLLASMSKAGSSDWLKAMAMFLFIPYGMFLCLSAVNQFFRVHLTPCAKRVTSKERKRCLTTIAHKQWVAVRNWPFTGIFMKVSPSSFLHVIACKADIVALIKRYWSIKCFGLETPCSCLH